MMIRDELRDDLTTVLESYMDEIGTEELFYSSIKFLTLALYDCTQNHKEALKVLRSAVDDGIKIYMDNKEK